jgi:hypothetical protein
VPVNEREHVLTLLAEAPPRIAEITAGLDEDRAHAFPSEGEWSVNDVLAHLRSCADVWGDYIARILAEERPTIRAVSPRTWIKRTDYREIPFAPSLEAFLAQRAGLLAVLQPLSAEEWSRAAIVFTVGAPIERWVWSYAERMAVHERDHVRQIQQTVAALSGSPGDATP